MTVENLLFTIAVNAVPLVLAITLHEVAHGYVAGRCGDPTARAMGRLTLNPVAHIDPFGTVLLPLFLLAATIDNPNGPILFGWARPVPVNFANLRKLRKDSALVALAGPGSNLLQFTGWALVLLAVRAAAGLPESLDMAGAEGIERITIPVSLIAIAGLRWNFMLGVVNLIPILPLDGGRVLSSALPPAAAERFSRLEPFGFPILVALLYFAGEWFSVLFVPLRFILEILLG